MFCFDHMIVTAPYFNVKVKTQVSLGHGVQIETNYSICSLRCLSQGLRSDPKKKKRLRLR